MSKLINTISILSLVFAFSSCVTTKKIKSVQDVRTVVRQGHIAELSDRSANYVIKHNEVAVIEVSATWCKSCKEAKDALHRVAWKNRGKYLVGILDEKKGKKFMRKFEVESFPTFFVFEQGKLVRSYVGVGAVADIDDYLKNRKPKSLVTSL